MLFHSSLLEAPFQDSSNLLDGYADAFQHCIEHRVRINDQDGAFQQQVVANSKDIGSCCFKIRDNTASGQSQM